MIKIKNQAINILLVIVSAFLVSSAFFTFSLPKINIGTIVPFSLIPLFIAVQRIAIAGENNSLFSVCKKAIIPIWFFGFIVQLISFFWITKPIVYFGHVPQLLVIPFFCFVTIPVSFYFPILFWPFIFCIWYKNKFPTKKIFLFPVALTITLFEIIIPRFFNWSFGSLLSSNTIFNQLESLFGFNTGSLFIFYISLILSCMPSKNSFLFQSYTESYSRIFILILKQKLLPIINCFFIIFFVTLFGFIRIHKLTKILNESEKFRVAFVQPNFTFKSLASLDLPSKNSQIESLATMLKMSEQAIQKTIAMDRKKPDLLIWPESTTPDFFLLTTWQINQVAQLSKTLGVPFLIQFTELKDEDIKKFGVHYSPVWSSSAIIDSNGLSPIYFRKWKPMPFGEELPFENLFPKLGIWYRQLFKNASKIERGTNYNALHILNNVFVTPLICFDSISQELSFLSTKKGQANYFVNQANFVWMLDSNAGYEFSIINQMRAIENARSVIVASNSGPSLALDPLGRLLLPPSKLLTQEINFVDIPLSTEKTLFQSVYYWPLVILGVLSICYFIAITIKNSFNNKDRKNLLNK